MTSTGSLCTYRDDLLLFVPSAGTRAFERLGWEAEGGKEALRVGDSDGAGVLLAIYAEKTASPAAIVGSSRFDAAGVPVRDRERRVDFPKEPVSCNILRDRKVPALPSVLKDLDGFLNESRGLPVTYFGKTMP